MSIMPNLRKNLMIGYDVELKNFINLTEEEKELVRNCRNNIDVRKWMYSDTIISPEEHKSFIINLKNDDKNCYWIVQKGQEYVGVISLNNINMNHRNACLGIYSNPFCKFKNKGELLIRCLKHVSFSIAKLHTLKLEVMENNVKAINFYKKSGFKEEGRLKEFIFKNGNWYDMIVMGIVEGEGIDGNESWE